MNLDGIGVNVGCLKGLCSIQRVDKRIFTHLNLDELCAGSQRLWHDNCSHILTPTAAQHGLNVAFHEHIEERELRCFVRRLKVGTVVDGRERDEVDLARGQTPQTPHELLRARARIVQAIHKRVLKGDHPTRLARVRRAGGEQLVDRPPLVDGHQLRAEFVVRRVERHGKLELIALRREFREARHDAARGERDVARAEVRPLPRVEELQRAQRRVVVRERLAHAHHHEVREAEPRPLPSVFRRGEETLRRHHLGHDLVRLERPHEPLAAARAERAPHRAPHLRGDALREASLRGDHHRLHGVAVGKAQQQLGGPVLGAVLRQHLRHAQRELRLQRLAEVLGERGGVVPVRDPVAVEALQDLVRAERAQAPLHEKRLPLVRQHRPRRSSSVLHSSLFTIHYSLFVTQSCPSGG